MTAVDEIVDIVGPVAAREFEAAAGRYKPGLIEWARALPGLPDDEFEQVCGSAIYDSALVSRFRGNWEHEHFKASACAHEARRRHVAAGHDEDCRGETIYGGAHARIMRENGYRPTEPGACRCQGREG
jgi:hypothetical protein